MCQLTGTVVWFNNAKGYGFLKPDEGPEVFVHFSAIVDGPGYKSLKVEERVTFEVVQGDKGKPQAANVQRVPS